MSLGLPREAFLSIATVGWADGWMRKNEIDGLLRAAQACGVSEADRISIAAAAKEGVDLDTVDLGALGDWERALTYAIAAWLAKLDGVANAQELKQLQILGRRLDLQQRQLDLATSAVMDIAILPEGHRPEKFDFDALATRLREKLPLLK
ncbi:MAG: hypothetical protein HS104_30300 [Polyangiaceae bacterium]|nr:hypothetical protein [Polyangiaceae bacterium]MCE7889319.1 hypothetical protein [Sorangiineae bacterium PRO1]MCL4753464.1 hypothetical protein [Myxococcales bacterium]